MDQGLIFGAGQAGSYLAELLLKKNYKVTLATRRSATGTRWRLNSCIDNPNFSLIECDVTDCANVFSVISKYKPIEIYNTACQSHVKTSFDEPMHTFEATGKSQLNILEAIRQTSPESKCLFFSSSETFGNNYTEKIVPAPPQYDIKFLVQKYQNELTPFAPTSPYSISKLAAYNFTKLYREAYNLKTYSSIFFNMESPRRGINFVTRKIVQYFYFLKRDGFKNKLKLGNLDSYRDWGYVPDSVYGGWLVLQQQKPKEYVFSTGETHSIREFLDEVGYIHNLNWKEYVEIDQSLFRLSEVNYLRGDSYLVKEEIGWAPSVKFQELISIMIKEENGLP